jgi:hypothetical protein
MRTHVPSFQPAGGGDGDDKRRGRRARHCRCSAHELLPCVKHITWFGVAHLFASLFALVTAVLGAVGVYLG